MSGPSDAGFSRCLGAVYINAREIRELKDTLNSTRRELDDVRSELKRQNNTIAKVT